MAIRLSKATRELNVAVSTLVDFLHKKGFSEVTEDLNQKLTDEQYNLLVAEYSHDRTIREEAARFMQYRKHLREMEEQEMANESMKHENIEPEEIETVLPEEPVIRFKTVNKIDLNTNNSTSNDKVILRPVREESEVIETEIPEEPVITFKTVGRIDLSELNKERRDRSIVDSSRPHKITKEEKMRARYEREKTLKLKQQQFKESLLEELKNVSSVTDNPKDIIIDISIKWEIGAIIYYDNHVNYKGIIAAFRSKHKYTYHFTGNDEINSQNLVSGDLVFFSKKDDIVEKVYAMKCVANYPWTSILKHVGFYTTIEFDRYLNRDKTESKHFAIPVIDYCLKMLNSDDENNLWVALYKRIKSYETNELKDEYIKEVFSYGIQDLFINNCVNRDYYLQLKETDEFLVSPYTYLVNSVYSIAIQSDNLKLAVQVINCLGFNSSFDSFIDKFNAIDDDWKKQKEIIQSSDLPEDKIECFEMVKTSNETSKLSPRNLLALALIREKPEYLEAISDNFDERTQSWFKTMPSPIFKSIIKYIDKLDASLVDVYVKLLKEWFPTLPIYKDYILKKWNEATLLNYLCIDIETDRVSISEAAALKGDYSVESYGQSGLKDVISAIESADIIIGHNIRQFDLPELNKNGLKNSPNHIIWDTYEMEMVLDPTRFSYALDTAHTAKEDAILCEQLFWNQLYRICNSEGRYDHVKGLLSSVFLSLIDKITRSEFKEIFQEKACIEKKFFRESNKAGGNIFSKLKTIQLENKFNAISKGSVIIAPKDIWPEIANLIKADFPTSNDIQYSPLSKHEIYNIKDPNSIKAAILRSFVDSVDNPLIIKLSKAVRVLIKDEELSSYVSGDNANTGVLCTDSFGIDKLGNLESLGITDIYTTGYEIESRMNQKCLGEPYSAADLIKNEYGKRLLLQLSGSSYTPLSRKDCLELGIEDIPLEAKNFWMQKNDNGLYQIYCNRIFSLFIQQLKELYPSIEFHGIDWSFSDDINSKITVVSTKKLPRFDARIKRVNSTSLYRSMYWTYQFALLEGIQSSLVKILYIDNSHEIESLERYAVSKGYYVPDSSISIQRRIELCQEKETYRSLIIISTQEFNILRQIKLKYPYCLIWDNLDTDCLQVMWRGMLPFGDEPDYAAEVDNKEDNDKKKDIPTILSCILGVWPRVQYYCKQFFMQDEQNEVYIMDPSFDDYKELEKSFNAKKLEVILWEKDETYQEELKTAQQYFAGRYVEKNITESVDEVMDTVWQVFIAPKLKKGTNESWSDIQKKAFPIIYKRETNTLVSIPTGGGKSVLFQGASLYRAAFTNRLSLVVTPLKALMQDQVETLHELGFVTNVEYLNSDKTRPEINRIYRKVTGGEIALLYITPERFRSRGFKNALFSRMQVDSGLEYIIFDEAHCISQWGLDFRPEYLSAAQKCSDFVKDFPETRIEMFSATVTGQVQSDIEKTIRPIKVITDEYSYNPIRNHIGMQFEVVKDKFIDRIESLYGHIRTSGFNPEMSRILVFCRRRRDTEEGCEMLKTMLRNSDNVIMSSISDKIGYFHAGMDTDDRAYAFSQYKNGDFVILFATKAFGMGMDLPNIHYIYHLNPPEFIEDYLQEVGRAGRSKDQYLNAGFNSDNPIPTICFVSIEDFKNMKTLLAQSMLSWMNVRSIYITVQNYLVKFQRGDNTKRIPIAVPDTLWKKETVNGATTDSTGFRLGLYWLERMGRINMGDYAPTTVDLSMPKTLKSPSIIKDEKLKVIYDYILSVAGGNCEDKSIQIYINDICSNLSIGQQSLFRFIIQGTKLGLFTIASKTSFDLTKLRKEEMKYSHKNGKSYYVIDAIFDATKSMLNSIKLRETTQIDIHKRNAIITDALDGLGLPQGEDMPWYNAHSTGLSKTKSYIQDVSFKRGKFIFDIIDMLPSASIKTSFDTNNKQVIQEIYLSSNKWQPALEELKNNSIKLLDYLIKRHISNNKDFIWADAITKLELPESYQYFCNLITILRFLGFIKVDSILSTGIEITLTENEAEIEESPIEGLDKDIYDEFVHVNHLKDIKFALMSAFRKVKQKDYNYFIQEYFKCETELDYMNLLNAVISEDDRSIIDVLSAAAIKVQEDRLDVQQRAIYDAPIDKDINVLAGPGSGKTHVLTLRCARLVIHENILPQNILVLAYNRAVVEELKTRLSKLFGELGHGSQMNRLQIFTFHGLAKRYCRDIQNNQVDQWEEIFLDYVKNNPGEFLSDMGNIQYVLIDEFQDITQVRLDLILEIRRLLTTPVSMPRFFTIGDINQSIYGFDKLKKGQPMDPMYYYKQLFNEIHPETMVMSLNYRSFQGILDEAFKFIPNTPMELKPKSSPSIVSPSFQYIFVKDEKQIGSSSWAVDFATILDSLKQYNSTIPDNEKSKAGIKTIALFFRNNNEVYQGYSKVRKMKLPDVRIRVQGSSSEFYRTRECNKVIRELRKQPDKQIPSDFDERIKSLISEIKEQEPYWNEYYLDLTYALVLDYYSTNNGEILTYSDVADYLEDIGEQDDGQLSKIYHKHFNRKDEDDSIEVILTTMHKVKGLEFDAVVVTPSYQSLGYDIKSGVPVPVNNFEDVLGEEKRLYFVAYTRAKKFLYVYRNLRDDAIMQGRRFLLGDEEQQRLGISFSQGIDKVNINYTAKKYGINKILSLIKKDDPITLCINRFSGWDICYIANNGGIYKIGELSSKECDKLNKYISGVKELHGLFVNDVIVWRYKDTLDYDRRNIKDFALGWSEEAKKAGFIYVVDFAGFIS